MQTIIQSEAPSGSTRTSSRRASKPSRTTNPRTDRETCAITIGRPKQGARIISACIADWAAERAGDVPLTEILIEVDNEPIECDPTQARATAAQFHHLAEHLATLADHVEHGVTAVTTDFTAAGPVVVKPAAALPYWQTEPCPTWCTCLHEDRDRYADRGHWFAPQTVELSTVECVGEYDGKPYCHAAEVSLSLQQHYRDAEPHLELEVPVVTNRDAHTQVGQTVVQLTATEARALRDRLAQLLDAIDASGGAR